jgi:coronatine-insensitive protein 1
MMVFVKLGNTVIKNVRWMLLGNVGETDAELLKFSKGCRCLKILERRGCFFSEYALATAFKCISV